MNDSVVYWEGRHIDTLTREELIKALNWASAEITRLRNDRNEIRPHIDWAAYVMGKTI